MDIDLQVLRSFLVVAEEHNVSAAARRLFVSQPALSGQVRRLERNVGLKLFERGATGVTLTDAGRAFLPYAEQAIAAVETGVAEAAATTGHGVLRIDVLDLALTTPSRVVERLRERLPRVTLEVSDRGTAQQVRELRAGKIDIAVCGHVQPENGLLDTPLLDEPYGVAVASAHRLANHSSIALVELKDELHYLPRTEFAPEWVAQVLAHCAQAGFIPRTLPLRTESTHAPLQLVAAGECVAISLFSTPVPAGVRMVPLAEVPDFSWVLRSRPPAPPRAVVAAALSALSSLDAPAPTEQTSADA